MARSHSRRVRRRDVIAALGVAAGTPGCAAGYTDERSGEGDDEVETLTLAERGVPPTICEEELSPGGIRAIDDPAFGPGDAWPAVADGYRSLDAASTVIGLTTDSDARAYPLSLLNVHEIVNDDFGGPVLVTYCPICRSGMVAERQVGGDPARFDASGLLWTPPRIETAAAAEEGRVFSDSEAGVANNGNLVMYDDRTGSYWSQMLARGICGPMTEVRLQIRPSTVTTWGTWRDRHPDTEVLLPPPKSGLVDPPI